MKDKPSMGGVGDTQVIDLQDVDLSALPPPSSHKLPPPLPPASFAPAPPIYSIPPAPAGRSTGFYVAILGGVLVVSIVGGVLVARSMHEAKPPPSPKGVMTIPTVEVDDK